MDSGGTCVCPAGQDCVVNPPDSYMACLAEVKRDLITTTAAIASLSSCLMGFFANLPVGMAPGLGLNAYVRLFSNYLVLVLVLSRTAGYPLSSDQHDDGARCPLKCASIFPLHRATSSRNHRMPDVAQRRAYRSFPLGPDGHHVLARPSVAPSRVPDYTQNGHALS